MNRIIKKIVVKEEDNEVQWETRTFGSKTLLMDKKLNWEHYQDHWIFNFQRVIRKPKRLKLDQS